MSAEVIYPKGTAVKFTRGRRMGEVWFVERDYDGGALYLAEFSNKTRSLIGGIVLIGDEVGMVSDSIGLQLTDLQ